MSDDAERVADDAIGRAPEPPTPVVDVSPAYDLLVSLVRLTTPKARLASLGRWRAWQEETTQAMSVAQWRRVQRWFDDPGDSPVGLALLALVPRLSQPNTIADFFRALRSLPLADFLRLVVTSAMIDPQTPLAADDLLALVGDRTLATHFIAERLRLTPRQRTLMLSVLADPEAERADLLKTLETHHTQVFAALGPQLQEERARAADRMRDILAQQRGAIPIEWVAEPQQLRGFSPVVLAPVPMLGTGHMAYYHEIERSLFDGAAYEPFIVLLGAEAVFALGAADAPGRRGARKSPLGARSADPAERWASLYAALGDPTRLRIVRLLAERPRYGQELATTLHISGATISHHMDALSHAGILALERRAHRTYFTLQGEALATLLRDGERYLLTGEDAPRRDTRWPSDEQVGG